MILKCDTREPMKKKLLAQKAGFRLEFLEFGDYSSETVVVERKDIMDLVQSMQARFGDTPRLFLQMEKLFEHCQTHNKIPMLLVTGTLDFARKKFAERKQTLNGNAVFGALASVMVRYNIPIMWTQEPFPETLEILKSFFEKVEEGKFMLPMRKTLRSYHSNQRIAVVCAALQVSPRIARRLLEKYRTPFEVIEAIKLHPSDIMTIDGIGEYTFRKMKKILGLIS